MQASLSGDSDLDILFDSKQKSKIETSLLSIGFKRFESIRQKQYQDVVDYFKLDQDSGKLIHLHAHFKLRMGKPFLKEYDLNLEQKILNSRLFNTQYDTYCIHPNYQLILLYLIESLKLRTRDRIRSLFKRKRKLSLKTMSEYQWLKTKANPTEVRYILHEILKHPAPVCSLIENELSLPLLFKLANDFEQEFSDSIEYPGIIGALTRWYRELVLLGKKALVKILGYPIPLSRVNPNGGRVLVLYGNDKTIANALEAIQNVFSKKLDVLRVSFGTSSDHQIALSRSDKSKLKRMLRAKAKGMLVLCDQFPLDPEATVDKAFQQFFPDIIFKWQEDESTPYEKTFHDWNNWLKVVPINPNTSFDRLRDVLNTEIWKLL
jgi:hypothetical protein